MASSTSIGPSPTDSSRGRSAIGASRRRPPTRSSSPPARRFEVGSANPAAHVALREAIDAIDEVGIGRIEDRVRRLAGRLADSLPDDRLLSPSTPESGLVTIDVDNPAETVDRLAAAGIVVRPLPWPNAVRASVHAVNTAGDVDRLLESLESEW